MEEIKYESFWRRINSVSLKLLALAACMSSITKV
jgi:hypothetical protein